MGQLYAVSGIFYAEFRVVARELPIPPPEVRYLKGPQVLIPVRCMYAASFSGLVF